MNFAQATDLWWTPIRTTLRDLAGFSGVDQGILIVPNVLVESEATLSFDLTISTQGG